MSTNFPTGLDTYTTLLDNVDAIVAAHINNPRDAVAATQVKIGVDNSTVNTTIDYWMKNSSGAFRTHTHDATSDDGAKLDWDTCWADAVHNHSSNAEGGTLSMSNFFGSWVNKSSSYSAQQAATDGFIICYIYMSGGVDAINSVTGYTDSALNPTTIRGAASCGRVSNYLGYILASSFCMPVKKNDYWKVVDTGVNAPTTLAVYWLPLSIS